MFREGMPAVTLPDDGVSRWFGPNDRRLREDELDDAGRAPKIHRPDPWVRPCFAPVFVAAARVMVAGTLTAIRLLDAEGRLCGVVMPVYGKEGEPGIVRLSTLCAYEVDRG